MDVFSTFSSIQCSVVRRSVFFDVGFNHVHSFDVQSFHVQLVNFQLSTFSLSTFSCLSFRHYTLLILTFSNSTCSRSMFSHYWFSSKIFKKFTSPRWTYSVAGKVLLQAIALPSSAFKVSTSVVPHLISLWFLFQWENLGNSELAICIGVKKEHKSFMA
jgi:hypothetical protein